jgi:hypothetical protein
VDEMIDIARDLDFWLMILGILLMYISHIMYILRTGRARLLAPWAIFSYSFREWSVFLVGLLLGFVGVAI